MKKLFSMFLILAFFCVCSSTAFAAEGKVNLYDGADLLTEAEELTVMERLDAVSATYNAEFVIATVDTVGGYSSDAYVEYFYDENGFGYGENRDGVLLLVAMEERDYRILSNGFCGDAIGADEIESISEEIESDLTAGNYVTAFNTFIEESCYWVDGELNGFPFNWGLSLLISLAIGLVVALIITGVMRYQLRSVRRKPAATEYTMPGSMNVTAAHDLFLYRTLTFHKKESNSSSGSSGGSRNVGGGSF